MFGQIETQSGSFTVSWKVICYNSQYLGNLYAMLGPGRRSLVNDWLKKVKAEVFAWWLIFQSNLVIIPGGRALAQAPFWREALPKRLAEVLQSVWGLRQELFHWQLHYRGLWGGQMVVIAFHVKMEKAKKRSQTLKFRSFQKPWWWLKLCLLTMQ